jgi:GrpB-like predicted nucleotidyltransferase (UPF0157 family)
MHNTMAIYMATARASGRAIISPNEPYPPPWTSHLQRVTVGLALSVLPNYIHISHIGNTSLNEIYSYFVKKKKSNSNELLRT